MGLCVYVYGVIGTNQVEHFGHTHGLEGKASGPIREVSEVSEVYTIPHEDIACVVKNTHMDSFSSMPKEALGRHLVEHQMVIERVMKEHTIIPFKFGTIAEGPDEVNRILQSGYTAFKAKLEKMDKNIELDLAALWNDMNSVIRRIGEENDQIRSLKNEIAKRPPQQTLQDRIKIGSMLKDALDEEKTRLCAQMLEVLREIVADCQKHELMDEKMILNCAFLLPKDRETDFDHALDELNKKYKEEVDFKCVGPLPPYSFSTIEIKRVGYEELDAARQALGLSEPVTIDGIKERYRELARKWHPDNNPDDPDREKRFENIAKAYKLLSNYCQQVGGGGRCVPRGNGAKNFILVDFVKG